MDFDYYEAKEDARSDFIAENSPDCEEMIEDFFDLLIFLNFDVSNFEWKYRG